MAQGYNILSQNSESTVVARYERPNVVAERAYQSEAELERDFIDQLKRQGYTYVDIHNEEQLIANLRQELERLNHFQFSDNEWQRFFKQELAKDGQSIVDKTITIQRDHVKTLTLDDDTQRNIYLIDKNDIHANSTQVINQYTVETGKRPNRYDVTILVNGLPMVHVELKRRGISLKEAFNQINRYGRESFWAGSALYEYVQLFVISNGTQTKYYSNTTRDNHVREQGTRKQRTRIRTSNSFEFTSYWADATNQVLNDLRDFTATFFSRHTLLSVLTRYCVLTEQNLLLAMRPYQIAATEQLLNQVEKGHNRKRYGTVEAGGYVWHTTGSGKTLTSFKAAQLATRLPYVDKVLFVVDRKDLDYQTMKEYDRFQKGAANGNTSTAVLKRQLEKDNDKIIITTIQKLSTFVKKNPNHKVYDKEVVMIFDECHRSQFGEMHKIITKCFKKYYIFGFTGTPIFSENIAPGAGFMRTTDDVFGRRLHTYTIVDAIRDRNVLPFRVAYIRTMTAKDDIQNEKVWSIATESLYSDPRRIKLVTTSILQNFDRQTKRNESYTFSRLVNVSEMVKNGYRRNDDVTEDRRKQRLQGFNSIMAVQSIEMAKLYYNEFKKQMSELPEDKQLKVATIFSYAVNDEVDDGMMDENSDSTDNLSQSDRDFLDAAIDDYNKMFNTSYDTSAEKFPNYYKDISLRMKNREIDLLIVVNMFLTGFDATTLNTLWVDKNLRYHGLLQAFSRTNRILNSVKTFGNIVCFRNLEKNTNDALTVFGDKDAHSTTILRHFDDYMNGYTDEWGKHVKGYLEMVKELKEKFEPGMLPEGEKAECEFIKLFGAILRMQNLLSCFEDFTPSKDPMSERERQDYTSVYIDLHEKYKNNEKHEATDVADDVEFEMELVKQVEVSIDYILFLVKQYRDSQGKNNEIRVSITKAIDASPDLRDKKELIEKFMDSVNATSEVDKQWRDYVNEQKRNEFAALVNEEHLRPKEAHNFIVLVFDRGYVPEGGLELNNIMPPMNPFDPNAGRESKLRRVVDRLKAFFNKFYEISDNKF